MKNYLAIIKGEAIEYSFGGNRSYDVNKNYRFEANDREQAISLAEGHLRDLRKNLLGARIFLESLLEIKDIKLL